MNDYISRQAVLDYAKDTCLDLDDYEDTKVFCDEIKALPSAELKPISEEYARAVLAWLLDYQFKAAELEGRCTTYEVLSWMVNDWRKENGFN